MPRVTGNAPHQGRRGLAVIEEVTTTLVVYPGAEVLVTAAGNYLIDVEGT